MQFEIDGKRYDVVIIKKKNKNSYIRIKDDLKIYVSTSIWSTKKDVERMLHQNYDSLQKMLNKKVTQLEKQERFFYLGKSYDIIEVSIMDNIEIEESRIYTPSLKELEKWYQKEVKRVFEERYKIQCENFNENIKIPKLKIRSMKTRWGVYNRVNHSITLNSHLIEYSIEKLDYVIVHELSHIIHFDHSKDFWNLVSKYCPMYKQIRKELKE